MQRFFCYFASKNRFKQMNLECITLTLSCIATFLAFLGIDWLAEKYDHPEWYRVPIPRAPNTVFQVWTLAAFSLIIILSVAADNIPTPSAVGGLFLAMLLHGWSKPKWYLAISSTLHERRNSVQHTVTSLPISVSSSIPPAPADADQIPAGNFPALSERESD